MKIVDDLKTGMRVTYNGIKYIVQRNAIKNGSLTDYLLTENSSNSWTSGLMDDEKDLLCNLKNVNISLVETRKNPNEYKQKWDVIWIKNASEEMTLADICKELGRDIKIVKY